MNFDHSTVFRGNKLIWYAAICRTLDSTKIAPCWSRAVKMTQQFNINLNFPAGCIYQTGGMSESHIRAIYCKFPSDFCAILSTQQFKASFISTWLLVGKSKQFLSFNSKHLLFQIFKDHFWMSHAWCVRGCCLLQWWDCNLPLLA